MFAFCFPSNLWDVHWLGLIFRDTKWKPPISDIFTWGTQTEKPRTWLDPPVRSRGTEFVPFHQNASFHLPFVSCYFPVLVLKEIYHRTYFEPFFFSGAEPRNWSESPWTKSKGSQTPVKGERLLGEFGVCVCVCVFFFGGVVVVFVLSRFDFFGGSFL